MRLLYGDISVLAVGKDESLPLKSTSMIVHFFKLKLQILLVAGQLMELQWLQGWKHYGKSLDINCRGYLENQPKMT